MAVLPEHLVQIREIGDITGFYWIPASSDGQHLMFEPGETLLWSNWCTVREPGGWELPDVTSVVVTDRRMAFLTTRFDTGGGWAGFGVAGLVIATTANVVSSQRAAKRSAGKVAIGHVRYEWITSLLLRHRKPVIGGPDVYLDLSVACQPAHRTLELWGPKVIGAQTAQALACTAARHRLAFGGPYSSEEQDMLQRYADGGYDEPAGGHPQDHYWHLPGDPETLTRLLAPR